MRFKKRAFIIILVGLFVVVPSFGKAATVEELQAQLQALIRQVQTLQAQVAAQQSSLQPVLPSRPVTVVLEEKPQNIPSFNRDLFFGMRNNSDVTDFQEFLTDQGYYAGPISGNFGLLTLSAVKKFQSANGINPTGYFGPRSRAIATQIIQKLVGQICPSEEGCEGNVLPAEKIYMTADSDLTGTVGNYLKIGFKAFGGSGNYFIQIIDGDIPGLSRSDANYPKDTIVLAGTPIKSGVFGITFLVQDLSAPKEVYGKERFTIVIKDKVSSGQPPVISGIKGPTTLKVGEEGIWAVEASDSNRGSLSYKVIWGDEVYALEAAKELAPRAIPFKQTATFSHIYYQAGVYNPVFYIVNDRGQEAKTSISVNVGEATPITVSEQVKCVFKGATIEQKCYTATDYTSPYYNLGCSGVGACTVDVKGAKGDSITWKSSCGGYAYTTMDGASEYAEFSCVSIGSLYIEPANSQLKIGDWLKLQALYQPPMPTCPAGTYCDQVMPAALPVEATWTSSNPGVASVVSNYGSKTAVVSGISAGTAEIKAVYYREDVPGGALSAVTKVNVNPAGTPSITVVSPNGRETWQTGSTQVTQWSSNNFSADRKIDVIRLRDAYGSETNLTVGTVNDGYEKIVVPAVAAGSYTLEIKTYSTSGELVFDVSDAPFSVVAGGPISIITTSLASATVGTAYSASIYASGGSGSYVWGLSSGVLPPGLSLTSGACALIVGPCQPPAEISGIPTAAETYTFTVEVYSNTEKTQNASQKFTIMVNPAGTPYGYVVVTSPNGGEQFQAGQTTQMPLKWSASCGSGPYTIALYKGGAILQNMVSTVYEGICSGNTIMPYYTTWMIPSTLQAGSDYRVGVISQKIEGLSDQSDAPFSIVTTQSPPPALLPPPALVTVTLNRHSQSPSNFYYAGTTQADIFRFTVAPTADVTLSSIAAMVYNGAYLSNVRAVDAVSGATIGTWTGSLSSVFHNYGSFSFNGHAITGGTTRDVIIRADISASMFNASCSSCVQNVWVNLEGNAGVSVSATSGSTITTTGFPISGNTVYFKYSASQSAVPSASSQQLASILAAMQGTIERISEIVSRMR